MNDDEVVQYYFFRNALFVAYQVVLSIMQLQH